MLTATMEKPVEPVQTELTNVHSLNTVFPRQPDPEAFGERSATKRSIIKATRLNPTEGSMLDEYLKTNRLEFASWIRFLLKLLIVDKAQIITAEQWTEYQQLKAANATPSVKGTK